MSPRRPTPGLPLGVAFALLVAACAPAAAPPAEGVWAAPRVRLGEPRPPGWAWVTWVAFSPDGRLLAASNRDRTVRVWEVKTGRLARRLAGHAGDVSGVAFADRGKVLASSSADGTVRLWDVASGKLLHTLRGHDGPVNHLAASPRGDLLASGGRDRTIRLWDPATGKQVRTFGADQGPLVRLAFSPKGDALASANADNTIRLWDPATGKELRRLGESHGWPLSIAFSPDGKVLASGRQDGLVRLWDVGTGKQVRALRGHTAWASGLAFSPDGRVLASASYRGGVRLWELATGKQRARLAGHTGAVWSLCFSPDGPLLASGSSDGSAILWDVTGRRRAPASARLSGRELEGLWRDLGDDAARAYRAACALVRAPGPAVPFLRKRLRPSAVDPRRVSRLIAALGDEDADVRKKSMDALTALGPGAAPAARAALKRETDPDVRLRLLVVLRGLEGGPSAGEGLRRLRALEVLEHVGDSEARAALRELAGDTSEGWLAREAAAALKRLPRAR